MPVAELSSTVNGLSVIVAMVIVLSVLITVISDATSMSYTDIKVYGDGAPQFIYFTC